MPSINIRVSGLNEVLGQFERLPENLEPAITNGLKIAGAEIVEQVQEELSQAFPPPSISGEPPHLRTGALRRSARIEDVAPLRVTLAFGGEGSMVPYAGFLEFGTSKMEPRPFVAPILARVEPEIANIIADEITRELPEALR